MLEKARCYVRTRSAGLLLLMGGGAAPGVTMTILRTRVSGAAPSLRGELMGFELAHLRRLLVFAWRCPVMEREGHCDDQQAVTEGDQAHHPRRALVQGHHGYGVAPHADWVDQARRNTD